MTALLGRTAVLLGFLGSLGGILTLAVGLRTRDVATLRRGPRYAWAVLGGAVAAVVAMQVALMVRHFRARHDDRLVAWAVLTTFVVTAFFFALMLGPANPFRTLSGAAIPADGPGPNPLLQNHPLVAFHPPLLYLGYVGFTIPLAFAVAALVTGRLGEGWLVETRRWTLFAWGFLTLGMVLRRCRGARRRASCCAPGSSGRRGRGRSPSRRWCSPACAASARCSRSGSARSRPRPSPRRSRTRAATRLRPGESASIAGRTVTYLGSSTVERANKDSITRRLVEEALR